MAQVILALPAYSLLARLAACGLFSLALLSLWRYAKDTARPAPIVPLIMLEFYLLYGFAQFFHSTMALAGGIYIPSEGALAAAAGVALIAAVMFLLGQRAGSLLFKKRSLVPWSVYPNPSGILPFAATIYAVCALTYAVAISLGRFIPDMAIRNILNGIFNPELAFLILLFLYLNKAGSTRRWVIYASFSVLLLLGITSGMIEGVIAPVYVLFLSSYMWKGQTKVKWLMGLLALYIILTPAKYTYRQLEQWGQTGQLQTSLQERLDNWKEALESGWSDPFAIEDALQTSTGRTSFIVQLAQVIDWTPGIVPYNRGAGFKTALLFFVPRFIWSSKPGLSDLTANRYATTFGLTTYQGTQVSTIGIFQPADGYWDWGLVGAMGYPFLYGLLVEALFLGLNKSAPQARLIGAFFTVSFFQGLVAFSNIIASLASLFVFSWVVLKGLQFLSQIFFKPRSRTHGIIVAL